MRGRRVGSGQKVWYDVVQSTDMTTVQVVRLKEEEPAQQELINMPHFAEKLQWVMVKVDRYQVNSADVTVKVLESVYRTQQQFLDDDVCPLMWFQLHRIKTDWMQDII